MEEGQPWGTNAPTLHCQWLQIFSSVTEGSCTHSEMSRLFSAEKNGEFPPIPRKIPTLAFSCKLGQKHWHSKFFFSLVIPRNPDIPECLASGILTHLNSQMKMLYLEFIATFPSLLLEVTSFDSPCLVIDTFLRMLFCPLPSLCS